jgi:hypothetical protein
MPFFTAILSGKRAIYSERNVADLTGKSKGNVFNFWVPIKDKRKSIIGAAGIQLTLQDIQKLLPPLSLSKSYPTSYIALIDQNNTKFYQNHNLNKKELAIIESQNLSTSKNITFKSEHMKALVIKKHF